jgi:hypothetical protein
MSDLQPIARNIVTIEGPSVRDMGFDFTTRMVRYLLAATPRHVWRLAGWHTLFPEAQLWVPRPTPFTLRKGQMPFTNLLRDELLKLGGVAAPHGGVPRDIRLCFTNRDLARRSLEKLLSWDFDRLVIAHSPCAEKDAKAFVRRAFEWVARPQTAHDGPG